jgi:hypothetical protein
VGVGRTAVAVGVEVGAGWRTVAVGAVVAIIIAVVATGCVGKVVSCTGDLEHEARVKRAMATIRITKILFIREFLLGFSVRSRSKGMSDA